MTSLASCQTHGAWFRGSKSVFARFVPATSPLPLLQAPSRPDAQAACTTGELEAERGAAERGGDGQGVLHSIWAGRVDRYWIRFGNGRLSTIYGRVAGLGLPTHPHRGGSRNKLWSLFTLVVYTGLLSVNFLIFLFYKLCKLSVISVKTLL